MRGQQRRLAAVLTLDVVGYSRLMGEDEAGTLVRLRDRRRTIIDPQVAAHRGRVVKGTGDGILAAFASAQDAIRAAIAIQRTLGRAQGAEPGAPAMAARVGINIGDILFEEGDIFGDGVNVAARIESAAPPGGICVSGRAADELRRVGVPFDDMGEHAFKNIAAPIRILCVTPEAIAAFAADEAVIRRRASPRYLLIRWRRAWPLAVAVLLAAIAIVAWQLWPAAGGRPVVLVDPLQAPATDQGAQLLSQSLSSDLARMIVGDDATIHVADAADPGGAAARRADFRITGIARTNGPTLDASVRLLGRRDGRILWSSDFSRPAAEDGALRQQIASRIADVLTCALGPETTRRDSLPLETLRVFLAGCELRHADWAKAAGYFRQVTQASPAFVPAWSCYAFALAATANDQPRAEAPAMRAEARAVARQAIALDPKAAEPYFALAITTPFMSQWRERDASIDRGLSLDPDNPDLLTARFYGLMGIGRVHDAAPVGRRAMERSPFSPVYASDVAEQLAYSGRLDAARQVLAQARERWPHEPISEYSRLEIEARDGNPATALAIMNDPASRLGLSPEGMIGWRALIAARRARVPAERARAVTTLLANLGEEGPSVDYMHHFVQLGRLDDAFAIADRIPVFPIPFQSLWFRDYMAPFRRDQRFMDVAARQGIASVWLATGLWPDFCTEDKALPYRCADAARRAVGASAKR